MAATSVPSRVQGRRGNRFRDRFNRYGRGDRLAAGALAAARRLGACRPLDVDRLSPRHSALQARVVRLFQVLFEPAP